MNSLNNYPIRPAKKTFQDKLLNAIYRTVIGRIIIKPFTYPWFSVLARGFLASSFSKPIIPYFVKSKNIDLSDYYKKDFNSFNDFFTRQILSDKRPIDMKPLSLVSPADGFLTLHSIEESSIFSIKNTRYSVKEVLKSNGLSNTFMGGTMVMIRLTVNDYHRFCYAATGKIKKSRKINGRLHTVNPIANDYFPIYKENQRNYTVIDTEKFGHMIQMEVGALCVGKIVNYVEDGSIIKGHEKGRFEFGGSTVLLFLEKNKVNLDTELIENSQNGYETIIKMGQKIGLGIE